MACIVRTCLTKRIALFLAACAISVAARGELVSHWPFDGTAEDAVGGNHGILGPADVYVGTGTWDFTAPNGTSGKLGDGLVFAGGSYPGPGNAVLVPDAPSLNSPSFTISTWVNTTQTDNYAGYVTKAWGANVGDPGGWMLDSSSGLRGSVQSDAAVSQSTSTPGPNIADGSWHSVAMTYDGNTLRLYSDGVLKKSRDAVHGYTRKDIMFGGDGWSNVLFKGKLDDAGYWNHALSTPEVKAVATLANHVDLAYDLGKAEELFRVFRSYEGNTIVDGRTWHATGGLTGGLGEVVKTGNIYSVRLDERGNGTTTGSPSPTNPPGAPLYAPITNPDTILGDWPADSQVDWTQYVEPIPPGEFKRYSGPTLVNTPEGDMTIRAWKYMPNVPEQGGPGIVETVNVVDSNKTAVILVHPWGIEDGQGWGHPQAYNAYGYAFEGLYQDNLLYLKHIDDVVRPFVDSMRDVVALVGYSLPGGADSTRNKLYRDYDSKPTESQRAEGQAEMEAYLRSLTGTQWPTKIPLVSNLQYDPNDYVLYDSLDYEALRSFLVANGIENVLLGGYATDMCVISTTAGYVNLTKDFNVFLVGDATLSAWPTTASPPNGYVPHPTRDELITASRYAGIHPIAITQSSWISINPVRIPGDLNGDGLVGSADLDLVRAHWGASVTPGDLLSGDISADGSVGSADLDIVRANWGNGPAAVPEPGLFVPFLPLAAVFTVRSSTRRQRR